MFGMRLDDGRDAIKFPSISRQFLGHSVQARSTTRQGRSPIFFGISRQFLGDSVPSPGRVLAAVGTYLDFQAFLGNFMDSMCRPCPGCVVATEVSGAGVQAMFGMHLGWDRDVAWFPGISR
ncbi:Hypothetical predicted protein [Olea europaea subsp. europaea]|uniref:Uncharacterized protein n=1 Tax=Olea europaea subsp. europaea TaxID=158383 RepID=A0A8S0PN38_OLEEU|nr:Hypothetical predicted protein [Olea europaea subsp. europaea]